MKKRLKKGPKLSLTARFRAARNITGQTIKEIKNASSVESLLGKHTHKGTCRKCNRETMLVNGVNCCVNCLFCGKRWINKFKKKASEGVCIKCGAEALIDKKTKKCIDCYTTGGFA